MSIVETYKSIADTLRGVVHARGHCKLAKQQSCGLRANSYLNVIRPEFT
jgi:hypothetical protein